MTLIKRRPVTVGDVRKEFSHYYKRQNKKKKKRKFKPIVSPIENILFEAFQKLGYAPKRQFRIGKYYVDLCFPAVWLVIECDGFDFHSTPDQLLRDKLRTVDIESKGFEVTRFTGQEIYYDAPGIVKRVLNKYFYEHRDFM